MPVQVSVKQEDALELPLTGAAGFAPVTLAVYDQPNGKPIGTLSPGSMFIIRKVTEQWWKIDSQNIESGWINNRTCMINLPDVIPSIVYDNSNGMSSLFRTSGNEIPGITGQTLYDAFGWNKRLQKDEYTVAVLYPMAKRIYEIQQMALKDGYTLVLYEGFRPYDVQQDVVNGVLSLIRQNPSLRSGIDRSPWSLAWFITPGVSNHQQGYAIDVSLGRVTKTAVLTTGNYSYTDVTEYSACTMPTAMHELSIAAASMTSPVSSTDATAWQYTNIAPTMTSDAIRLRKYCTDGGLTPLASEWWHFGDLHCLELIDNSWQGKFRLPLADSVAPS